MNTYFSRFLHRILSCPDTKSHTAPSLSLSDIKPQSTSVLSPSGLTRWSRSKQVANWLHLDTPVKPECDSLCAGRSMVEMLGVLAIIGVLSVGAISGYSKAMIKYKLNKQSEQLTQILFSLEHYREMLGRDRNNIANDTHVIPLLIKLNAIPLEMIKPNDNLRIYDVFGNYINISYYGNGYSYNLAVNYQPNQQDVCNNVFELIKANSEKLYSAGVKINQTGDFASPELNSTSINKLSKSDIYNYCALCKTGPYCRISANFKFD